MTTEQFLWSVLLLLVTTGLLALPFYPAWAEWHHPSDRQAHPAGPGTPLPVADAASRNPLRLAPGASFDKLPSACLVLGSGPVHAPPPLPALLRWQPPAGARPWGVHGWHIGHPLDIAAGHVVPCSLVVRGRLSMQGPGLIEGDVKTRGNLRLGAGTRVEGNLFSEGDIWLDAGCTVSGLVMAEGSLHLAPGVVIGTPQHRVSVCADVIEAHGPVQVHGSVQARLGGHVACL